MIYLSAIFKLFPDCLFSFGGGYGCHAADSGKWQGHGWLSMEFTDLITISQMTPCRLQSILVTFVGIKIAGIPGAPSRQRLMYSHCRGYSRHTACEAYI